MRKSIKIFSSIFLSSMFAINGILPAFATDDVNESANNGNVESKKIAKLLLMKILQ